MSTTAAPRPLACPACGKAAPSRAHFCPYCGVTLKSNAPVQPTAPPQITLTQASPEAVETPELRRIDLARIQAELPARYRVERLLGRGGMGVVFKCRDESLDRVVAIKLMSERYAADTTAQRRFLREARAQATINHPNVATILNAVISTNGRPCLVMEFVEGADLKSILHKEPGGLDPTRVCDLMLQACAGLSEAHATGIIHRDLKPSNFIIQRDHKGQEQLKILDLGLAKIVGCATDLRTITMDTSKDLVGTPAYMSPEQVNGTAVDHRTDLYSLGVVLFELFTGRLPFDSESLQGWLYQHLHAEPPVPSSMRPTLARFANLDSTVLWCLAKQPHVRPSRADDLAYALKRIRRSAPNPQDSGSAFASDVLATSEPLDDRSGMHLRSAPDIAPSSVLRRPSTAEFLKVNAPGLEAVSTTADRAQFLKHANAAEETEAQQKWAAAIEHWKLALAHADDPGAIARRIEALDRELTFEQVLATAGAHAAAGDWARAEAALRSAASLRPGDPRVEQARARLPRRLLDAWFHRARERIAAFTDGPSRQTQIRRLAVTKARSGDLDGAILLLQVESHDPELRICGLAQALSGAVQAGHREGLRPYLERAIAAASNLPDPAARGRASLEVGRALTTYGDNEAARTVFHNALTGFVACSEAGDPVPSKSNTHNEAIWGTGITTTTRRLPRLGPPEKEKARAQAISAVATAQAQAGLPQEALSTAYLIDDPWNRALILVQVAQALAKAGNTLEAERIADQITFRLPKAKALRAVAVSHVFRGEMEVATKILNDIASPEERAPILGFMASAWARRGDLAQASQYARDAYKTANEVPGTVARIDALLNAAEPLLTVGKNNFGASLLATAGRLVDGLDDAVERLHGLLRLARMRVKSRSGFYPAYGAVAAPGASCPELMEALRHATESVARIVIADERLECLEPLAATIASAGAYDLAQDLLSQCKDDAERSLVYIGLASGML